MRQITFILTISLFIMSCGQNETKQKELELKERELALKEKEFALRDTAKNNKIKIDSLTNQTTIQKQTVNNVPLKANFPDIQTFYNFFKQAVIDNNMKQLWECVNPGDYKNYKDFIYRSTFSNRVKKIIINTSSPQYYKENKCYGIDGNDGEEGDAMLFTILFKKIKNGNWVWTMSYAG